MDGLFNTFHWAPPFVVAMMPVPTAMQSEVVEQSTPLSVSIPFGAVSTSQLEPPLLLLAIAAPGPSVERPTATQNSEFVQAIELKFAIVDGCASTDHDTPPSVVSMMLGKPLPGPLTA